MQPVPLSRTFSSPETETLYLLAVATLFSLPQLQEPLIHLFLLICVFWIFDTNGIIQFMSSFLTSSLAFVFKFHPCCSIYQNFILFYTVCLFIIKEIRAGRIAPVRIVGLLSRLTCWSLPEGHKSTGKPKLKTECRNHDPLAKNCTEQTSIRELEGARQIFIWETDSIVYPNLWMNLTQYSLFWWGGLVGNRSRSAWIVPQAMRVTGVSLHIVTIWRRIKSMSQRSTSKTGHQAREDRGADDRGRGTFRWNEWNTQKPVIDAIFY